MDYREYIKNQIVYGVKKQAEEELLVELEGQLSKCVRFKDMLKYVSSYFHNLACDGFGVVVDKRLLQGDIAPQFPTEGYDWSYLVAGYLEDKGQVIPVATVEALEEYLETTGSQCSYLFTPVHFGAKTVGYTVMKNGRFLYDNPYFYDMHSTIVRCMENLYKRKQLEWANQKLMDTYNKDPLTGVYNRMAYSQMIEPEYKKYREMGQCCAMMFLDADHFKEINDTYGHEYGDMVLKKIAGILQFHCPKDGYVFRFGGDEFILFWPGATKESVETMRSLLEEHFAADKIDVSMGFVLTDDEEEKPLYNYLTTADRKMYAEKDRHRKREGGPYEVQKNE